MDEKLSKRLVIDTSIARAAGQTTGVAKDCRDLLSAVLHICHKLLMTNPIEQEWNKHRSPFARKWQVEMASRSKQLRLNIAPDLELWENIRQGTTTSRQERDAMHKDFHLIEAALATDKIVFSLDETARTLFAEAAQVIYDLGEIMWINPQTIPRTDWLAWLQAGTPLEPKYQLGYKQSTTS